MEMLNYCSERTRRDEWNGLGWAGCCYNVCMRGKQMGTASRCVGDDGLDYIAQVYWVLQTSTNHIECINLSDQK
jgi:hypothetical protein